MVLIAIPTLIITHTKYTDPTGMSSYGAQQMSVTMAPNKKAAKAIHSSYTAPRSGSDTTKIVAGAALTMTGNLVPGVITMGEGLTGESLVEQGALAAGFTSEQATYTSIGSDLIGGLTGMLKGIGKIISNFGPETVSGMSKGGIEAVSESAVLVNEGDQVPEKLQKIREDKNEN
jgi:hypothetical protein